VTSDLTISYGARQAALDSRIFVYRSGDYANYVLVNAQAELSTLTQDDDNRRAGSPGFSLPEELSDGPVRVHFEYGCCCYSRIGLGLLE
jgi:hypothetical protein